MYKEIWIFRFVFSKPFTRFNIGFIQTLKPISYPISKPLIKDFTDPVEIPYPKFTVVVDPPTQFRIEVIGNFFYTSLRPPLKSRVSNSCCNLLDQLYQNVTKFPTQDQRSLTLHKCAHADHIIDEHR